MRIGLVTDIHNHAAELAAALAAFRRHGVDRVVTLGDTCDAFSPGSGAAAVVALLREAGAVGVWGNHDFALSCRFYEAIRDRYDPATLEFMAGMEPWLEIDDCHFSHEEPWVDPYDPAQMWAVDELPPDLVDRARRSFAAVPHRVLFMGHYHRWVVVTPAGPVEWDARQPLVLEKAQRYAVVVGPVFAGWCGIYDTAATVLTPICCRESV
jgi:hypothetical protein